MRKFFACLTAAFLAAAPAMADEVWKTDIGEIMWETDYAGGAIFKASAGDGKVVRFYIEGLKPSGEPRGHFDGYWISTLEDSLCSAELAGPDGTRSRTWGRIALTFVDPEFPSDWTALTSDCLGEPRDVLTGHAVTG